MCPRSSIRRRRLLNACSDVLQFIIRSDVRRCTCHAPLASFKDIHRVRKPPALCHPADLSPAEAPSPLTPRRQEEAPRRGQRGRAGRPERARPRVSFIVDAVVHQLFLVGRHGHCVHALVLLAAGRRPAVAWRPGRGLAGPWGPRRGCHVGRSRLFWGEACVSFCPESLVCWP